MRRGEALPAAKTVIATQPDALREYGACLLKMKLPDEAAGVFPPVAGHLAQDRRAVYSLGVSLMDAARPRDAIAALEPLSGATNPDPSPSN